MKVFLDTNIIIDFEDTVQYLSSATADADVIITRDQHGFNDFPIQHISAEQFLDNRSEERRVGKEC